jgi:hypothetical protein
VRYMNLPRPRRPTIWVSRNRASLVSCAGRWSGFGLVRLRVFGSGSSTADGLTSRQVVKVTPPT